ncbi:hypothetical protein ITJ38_15185 [Agreia pratensis]|uniref:hypothetical protein n=1 Tax=Agreia pratensis TaxID=150121 RepID=UPI00188B5FF5|nr:hypothetical protein [Agreia pratensis]MBF4635756.1 hypothetical protein [Agreia pratensis]
MNSRWARVARGFLVAALSVFVAMFSHAVAGGSAPGAVGFGLALTFATLVSIAMAGRRVKLVRMAASVVVSQFAFHLLFSVGASTSSQFHQAGHHGVVSVTTGAASSVPMGHSDASMWASHAVAAVLTIAFLWRGERAVWRVLATASRRLFVVLIGAFVVVPVRTTQAALAAVPASVRALRDDLGVVLSALRHRGPPTAALSVCTLV